MILADIINWLESENYSFNFVGDANTEVYGFCSLENSQNGKITWIKKKENFESNENKSVISIAVVQEGITLDIKNQFISSRSKELFFSILRHFWKTEPEKRLGTIGHGTIIDNNVEIDDTAVVGNNCSIIGKIKIGKYTIIEDNVSIKNSVTIGSECLIHSGAVIGTDGFGFSFNGSGLPVKVEHFGGVNIGNRVEIGANTCIDRGTLDNTVIEDDVKIDNLVHIAHNVQIKRGAMVVAGAIVCGSAKLGYESYIAPGGIIKNQMEIGENSFVGLGAVVTKPVGSNIVVAGIPAKPIRKVLDGDK